MSLKDKLKHLTDETSSKWVEEAKEKVANKGVRRKARMIALEVLRILRERGMSQTDLATAMMVSRQQVAKIVKGQENLTLETIDKLEIALGVVLISIGKPEPVQKDKFMVAVESSWMQVAAHLPQTPLTSYLETGLIIAFSQRLPAQKIDAPDYELRINGQLSYTPVVYQRFVFPDVSRWDKYEPEETEMSNFS